MRRIIASILIILTVTFSLSADIGSGSGDYFLDSDIPVTYGEQSFRERILERTGGKRDPIGLVLTGGSARAFAHIGVLRYLEENDIVPDFIVSNSMGSLIGMCYAAGLSPDQIEELVTVGGISDYFDLTVPFAGGVLDPGSFKSLIESVTGKDLRIEDLPIPVMVICDDLVTKREIRICEGDFADIMLASFAMPVYFPPQKFNGHLLIDGGVKSLAPIDSAYDFTDTVILSTAFYDVDTLNLLNPLTILNGSFDIGKRQRAARDMKEFKDYIWVRCNVEQFSFMAFDEAELMAERGYEAAVAEADRLALLPKDGGEEFLEARESYSKAIERATDNLYYFGRIESASASNILSVGFTSYQDRDVMSYLKDSFDLGLQYRLRYKPLELTITGGGAFNTRTDQSASASPSLAMSFDIYPVPRLLLSADVSADWDAKSWIPSLYAKQGFNLKLWAKPGVADLQLSEAFEYRMGNPVHDERWLLTTELQGMFDIVGKVLLDADFGAQITGVNFKDMPRFYVQGGVLSRALYPYGFFTDLGVRVRGAVDKTEGVPLYFSDMYETNVLQTGGYGFPATEVLSIFSFTAGWHSLWNPALAETLMLNDLEIAGYCDVLLCGLDPHFSAGVEIQSVFSLIGLIDLPVRMRFGYDSLTDGFIMSTIFSTKF